MKVFSKQDAPTRCINKDEMKVFSNRCINKGDESILNKMYPKTVTQNIQRRKSDVT
jgi:hypothetical protein